jgi:hypothetical protein
MAQDFIEAQNSKYIQIPKETVPESPASLMLPR